MRTLTLFALVTLLTQAGCFFRSRGVVTAYNHAATVSATAGATAHGGATATFTNVTVNGQPATASVHVNGGSAAMSAGGPGASVSATVVAPTP